MLLNPAQILKPAACPRCVGVGAGIVMIATCVTPWSVAVCPQQNQGTRKQEPSLVVGHAALPAPHTNASRTIKTPGGQLTMRHRYTSMSYIGETGRRLRDRFREHYWLRNSADLPVAKHFFRQQKKRRVTLFATKSIIKTNIPQSPGRFSYCLQCNCFLF